MNIQIKKLTEYKCEYTITRSDQTIEIITLDVKTFLLHDITHYVVEKNLSYSKGFWGMLAQGFSFKELFGKENPLTEELRFIEKIVGPVQSTYSGHIAKQDLPIYLSHLQFKLDEQLLAACLSEIREIMSEWQRLTLGESLTLKWRVN